MITTHCRQLAHDIMKEDDKWIYNVKNSEIRQIVEFKNNSEVYRRLSEVDDVATLIPEERCHYEVDLKRLSKTNGSTHAEKPSCKGA